MDSLRKRLYDAMLNSLPTKHEIPELATFYKLIRNYPKRGGKLLRGQFVLLSTLAHGGKLEDALSVAIAVELFQNWVLIHDDIEDGSEERRGEPALHRQVGMPVALNTGDALHVYMWQVLLNLNLPLKEAIQKEFLTMIHRTAEGQHLDLSWVENKRFDISEQEYVTMVTLKTAYYTVISPLRLGALCSGLEPDKRYETLGKHLGIGFQIRDDVLNLVPGDGYGKEFAGDLYEGKRTLILAHLFSKVSDAERSQLMTYLSKERSDKTATETQKVLALIAKYNALVYAQKVANQRAEEGISILRNVLQGVPNQREAKKLAGLLESLAKRHA